MECLTLTTSLPSEFSFIEEADQKVTSIANNSMGLSSHDYDLMRHELASKRQKPFAWGVVDYAYQIKGWEGSWHVVNQVMVRALNFERGKSECLKYGCSLVPISTYLLLAMPLNIGFYGISVTDLFFYSIPARLYYLNRSDEKLELLAKRRAIKAVLQELESNLSAAIYQKVESKGTKKARTYIIINPNAILVKDLLISRVNNILEKLTSRKGEFWDIGHDLNITSDDFNNIKHYLGELDRASIKCD